MKYYEFSEPYALIAVVEGNKDTEEDKPIYAAIREYDSEIANIDSGFAVSECTREHALNQYKNAEIENCSTEEEKAREFRKLTTINSEKWNQESDGKVILLLVSRDLI